MPRANLTDCFIASLRPITRLVYFDLKARGLTLRLTPTGAKTWVFVYRAGGKLQWLTLGSYPAVSLAEARGLALEKRHAVDVEKRDPAAEQRAQRETAKLPPAPSPAIFTFADLAKLYETFARGRKKTWKDDVAKTKHCGTESCADDSPCVNSVILGSSTWLGRRGSRVRIQSPRPFFRSVGHR